MCRIAKVILSVAIVWFPITISAEQNPDVKLAMHVVASSASLTCADLTPASVADINPSVTLDELGAAGYMCYVVFVAYDFNEMTGVEFCATGLPPEVVVLETVWCPPGAPSIGDPWSTGVAVAFLRCVEPYDEGEVAAIGYVKGFWYTALGFLPAELTYCPSSLSNPGDPHNYAVDCYFMVEDPVVLEYPCVVGGAVTPTVQVASPDGGEVFVGGQVHPITWYSFGLSTVRLEYTTNRGDAVPVWHELNPSVITQDFTSNTYPWTIPNTHSTACRVRVSDGDGDPVDESDADFEILMGLELTSPNGGETWLIDTAQEITWNSQGVDSVKVEYGDGAGAWTAVVPSIPAAPGSYTWTVPDDPGTWFVRICDASDGAPCDTGDGTFEIYAGVQVISPNGGEVWIVGSDQDIVWTSAGVDSVKVEYGDGAGAWTAVVPSIPAVPGSYTWTVPDDPGTWLVRICDASDGAPCDTGDSQFIIRHPRVWLVPGHAPTVQAGIDSAMARDTVQVACGTYYEHDIAMKSGITLRSETGEPGCVTIDGSSAGPVIICYNVDSTAAVEGLTVTGGYSHPGGGIACEGSSLRITRCVIRNNIASASKAGGLLSSSGGHPSEEPTAIVPGSGGGMACYFSSPVVTDCIISGNAANDDGGGMVCYNSSPRIVNCNVTGNYAGYSGGGGFACYESSSPIIENTIIASSSSGDAVLCDGLSSATLTCCNVWQNAWGDWVGCLAGQQGTNGNISENPWFCDPENGDYHLRANSPCAPGGTPPGCDLIGALDVACESLTVNLETTVFTVPGSGYMDQPIPVTWTVVNSGADTVPGPWYDGIYLSQDAVPGDDELVTEYLHAGGLGNGSGYQVTDYVIVPPRPEGDYWLIATVDSRNHIYEEGGEDDNETISAGAIHLTFERKTWYVDVNGSPGVDCDCNRISACLDSSAYADTVLVAHGTYHEYGISMRSGVTLRSEGRRADWVTIDATNAVQQLVMSCVSCDSTTVVEGFTMINGSKLYDAGGVYCNAADVRFNRCTIAHNTCTNRGGGMYVANCSPRLTNCTFYGNYSGLAQGGGIYCENSSPRLENTIIAFSTAGEAVRCYEYSNPVLTCCDVYGNAGGDWTGCIADQESLSGNFHADPLFCDAGGGDFHLDPASPCDNVLECGLVGADSVGCDLAEVAYAETGIPAMLYLGPAVPSPFSASTEIAYAIPGSRRPSRVLVNVYDALGRRVRTLVDADRGPGVYRVVWDGTDCNGTRVASGIYFCRLRWNGRSETRRMVLLR